MKRIAKYLEDLSMASADLQARPPSRATLERLGLVLLFGFFLACYVVALGVDLVGLGPPPMWPVVPIIVCGIGLTLIAHRQRWGAIVLSQLERRPANWRKIVWLLIGAGIGGSLVIVWVLRAFPNSGDEYDYLFQAKTFLAGRLWNPVPPHQQFFAFFWQFVQNGHWTTFYPPGWPILLATVQGLRLPAWIACPLTGGVLLFAAFKLGRHRDGLLGGILAVALIAFSPFFLFNAASYFMQVPAAAAGLLFCWAAIGFLNQPRPLRACLTGIGLGALGLIRPEDVPLFALPFAVEFLWRARGAHYRTAIVIVIAGLPFLGGLLLYNHTVIGVAVPGITMWQSASARFGLFGINEFGQELTPLDDVHFAAARVVMLAGWASPLLVLGYVAAFFWIVKLRRLSFVDFIFPLFMITFLFVPFWGANQYGPRYYFEAYPPLVLTTVSGLAALLRDTAKPQLRPFGVSLLIAHLTLSFVALVFIAGFMRAVVDQRMDVYDLVRDKNVHNAVVVIRSPTGTVRRMFPLDLTRNGISLDGDVIYALDIPGQFRELQQLFPHRRFYVYERELSSPKGVLSPIN